MIVFLKIEMAVFKALEKFLVFLLCSLILVVTYNIVMRYFFSATPFWANEVSVYLFVWSAMTGASLGLHYQAHPSMDVLFKIFAKKPKINVLILALGDILTIAFLATVCVLSVNLTISMKDSLSEALKIPTAFIYAVIPVSFISMIMAQIANMMRRKIVQKSEGEEKIFETGVIK